MKTNLNHICVFLLVALLLAAVFAGCAKDKTAESTVPADNKTETEAPADGKTETEAPVETEEDEPTESQDGMYFTLNGAAFHIGEHFAEVKDQLGSEVKPSETVESCDESSDYVEVWHYYPGISIIEDKDGVIFDVEFSEGEFEGRDATLNGTVRLGSTAEDVKNLMGEPEYGDETFMSYDCDGCMFNFNFDEETGELTFLMVRRSG